MIDDKLIVARDPDLLVPVNVGDDANKAIRVSVVAASQLAFRFDGSASPILYYGEAAPGSAEGDPVWRIEQFDTSSGVSGKWANGAATFANIWTNRAALPYS